MFAFGAFFLFFLLRLALRRDWLATAAFVAVFVFVKIPRRGAISG